MNHVAQRLWAGFHLGDQIVVGEEQVVAAGLHGSIGHCDAALHALFLAGAVHAGQGLREVALHGRILQKQDRVANVLQAVHTDAPGLGLHDHHAARGVVDELGDVLLVLVEGMLAVGQRRVERGQLLVEHLVGHLVVGHDDEFLVAEFVQPALHQVQPRSPIARQPEVLRVQHDLLALDEQAAGCERCDLLPRLLDLQELLLG